MTTHRITTGKEAFAESNREAVRKNAEANGIHVFNGGDVYIDGTITLPERYQAGAIVAQKPTKLIQGKGPLFRLRGCGMQFSGQLQIQGNGVDPIFEVEGSNKINTGLHVFRDLVITNAPQAGVWVAMATPNEAHADNCTTENCHVFGKEFTVFKSYNQQALGWDFRECTVNCISDEDAGGAIGADLVHGGWCHLGLKSVNHPRFTLFKVRDFSPNNCQLTAAFRRDLPTTNNNYFTLLDATDARADWAVEHWLRAMRVTGFIPVHTTKWDDSQLWRGVLERIPAEKKAELMRGIDVTIMGLPNE